jgi:hypothetical protein
MVCSANTRPCRNARRLWISKDFVGAKIGRNRKPIVASPSRAFIPPAQIAIAPPGRACEYDNSQTCAVFTLASGDPVVK